MEHAGSTAAKMDFRCVLIRALKNMWPSGITVDGMVLDNLHLGRDPDREVQGETIQFASCAAGMTASTQKEHSTTCIYVYTYTNTCMLIVLGGFNDRLQSVAPRHANR